MEANEPCEHGHLMCAEYEGGKCANEYDYIQVRYESGMTMPFERADGTEYYKTGVWAVGWVNEPAEDYFLTQVEAIDYALAHHASDWDGLVVHA